MRKNTKILVVEDDISINKLLCDMLRQNGYDIISAFSGTEAIINIKYGNISMVLLDIMLPGKNGEDVLSYIRKEMDIPTIVISAREEIDLKVKILKMGADDYITKPFDIDEVLARIETNLRRYKIGKNTINEDVISFKDIKMNNIQREVTVNDKLIEFTNIEYKILNIFIKNPNKVFTKANLSESFWENEFLGDDNPITVHISNIRNKLSKYGIHKEYIQTVWGIGYKLIDKN